MKKMYPILVILMGAGLIYVWISQPRPKIDIESNYKKEDVTEPTTVIAQTNPTPAPAPPVKEIKMVNKITKKDNPLPTTVPIEVIEEKKDTLPKSMADVIMTPKLKEFFDKFWNGSTEKIDFRLKLFDKLAECLGPQAPASGDIGIYFLFKSNKEAKIAIGTEGREDNPMDQQAAFQVFKSNLSDKDEENVILCAREAHIGLIMSIADKMNEKNSITQDYFYHPISIHFPLEEDVIYWLLAHEGEPPPQ